MKGEGEGGVRVSERAEVLLMIVQNAGPRPALISRRCFVIQKSRSRQHILCLIDRARLTQKPH